MMNKKEKYSLRLRCRSKVSNKGRELEMSIGSKADFIHPIIVVHTLDRNVSPYDIALRKLANALNRGSQRSMVHGASNSSKQARTSELEANVVSGLPQYAARISYPAACKEEGECSVQNVPNIGMIVGRGGQGEAVWRRVAKDLAYAKEGTAGGVRSSIRP